jgi:hypothetical protein
MRYIVQIISWLLFIPVVVPFLIILALAFLYSAE